MAFLAPVFAAVSTWWASVNVGTLIVNTLVTIGVSKLYSSLTAKNNQIIDPGARITTEPATENHLPVVYGSAFIGGAITDVHMNDTNNIMWYCIALSETTGTRYSTNDTSTMYVDKIYWQQNRVVFQDDGVTVDKTVDENNDDAEDTSMRGLVKIYFYRNGYNNPALPVVDAAAGNYTPITGTVPGNAQAVWGGGGIWPNTNRMEGTVFALVRLQYNRDKNITGLQQMQFHITNTMKQPGDVFYDYMTNKRYGAGIDTTLIDTDASSSTSVQALNTYSAESVTYDGTETLANRYQINGFINTADTVLNNAERIALACGSYLTYDIASGQWGTVINKPGNVELSTGGFDSSNIIGQISLTGTALDQLYNSVEARYPNRDTRDQTDIRLITLNDLSNADLQLRNANEPDNKLQIDLSLCNEPVQAEILAKLELADNRNEGIISFNTDFSRINTEAGDFIAVTNDAYGWDEKTFRVLRVVETEGEDSSLVVQITAKEYNVDVYDAGTLTRPVVTSNVGITSINSIGVPAAPTFTTIDNVARPSIVLSAVVPTGNNLAPITTMEFFVTEDTTVSPDTARQYYLLGSTTRSTIDNSTTSNIGRPLVAGSTVTLTTTLNPKDYYFKVRGTNTSMTGAFSGNSSMLSWNPTQVPDSLNSVTTTVSSPSSGGGGSVVSTLAAFTLGAVASGLLDFGEIFGGGGGGGGGGSGGNLTLSPTSLTAGTQGDAYSETITASGGTGPYTYTITTGTPGDGVSLSGGGVLSGVPTTYGTKTFRVTATDSTSPTPLTGYQDYVWEIAQASGGGGSGNTTDRTLAINFTHRGQYNPAMDPGTSPFFTDFYPNIRYTLGGNVNTDSSSVYDDYTTAGKFYARGIAVSGNKTAMVYDGGDTGTNANRGMVLIDYGGNHNYYQALSGPSAGVQLNSCSGVVIAGDIMLVASGAIAGGILKCDNFTSVSGTVAPNWSYTASGYTNFYDIKYDGTNYVAVGSLQSVKSTDATNWTAISSASAYSVGSNGSGRWVFGSYSGANGLRYTDNLSTFTSVTGIIAGDTVYAVHYAAGVWVIGGESSSGGFIAYSTNNAASFTRISKSNPIEAITYSAKDGLFYAGGPNSGASTTINLWSSANGSSWSQVAGFTGGGTAVPTGGWPPNGRWDIGGLAAFQ